MYAAIFGVCSLLFGLLCGVAAGTCVGVIAYIKWHKNGRESQRSHSQPTRAPLHYEDVELYAITRPPVETQLQLNIAYGHVKKC